MGQTPSTVGSGKENLAVRNDVFPMKLEATAVVTVQRYLSSMLHYHSKVTYF